MSRQLHRPTGHESEPMLRTLVLSQQDRQLSKMPLRTGKLGMLQSMGPQSDTTEWLSTAQAAAAATVTKNKNLIKNS